MSAPDRSNEAEAERVQRLAEELSSGRLRRDPDARPLPPEARRPRTVPAERLYYFGDNFDDDQSA